MRNECKIHACDMVTFTEIVLIVHLTIRKMNVIIPVRFRAVPAGSGRLVARRSPCGHPGVFGVPRGCLGGPRSLLPSPSDIRGARRRPATDTAKQRLCTFSGYKNFTFFFDLWKNFPNNFLFFPTRFLDAPRTLPHSLGAPKRLCR